jgi:hypothetical protein
MTDPRKTIGYTGPLGWDDRAPVDWVDVAASVALIAAVVCVIVMVGYVLTLPGGVV